MGARVSGLVVVLAIVTAAACGAGPTGRTPSTPAPSAPAPRAAPLSAWRQLGATKAPPSPLPGDSLQGIQVVDQGGAGVTDAQAQEWAAALIRTYSYLEWAVREGQDAFLQQSGIVSSAAAVGSEVTSVQLARQAGVTSEVSRATIRRLVVRPLAAGLQPAFKGQLFTWTPYAIFLDAIGPGSYTWVDAQGKRTVKYQVPPGASAAELMGGAMADIPPMGRVWVLGSDWDCTAPNARALLGAACGQ